MKDLESIQTNIEAYLGTCQTIEFFKLFSQKAPSQMFDRALNTPLKDMVKVNSKNKYVECNQSLRQI